MDSWMVANLWLGSPENHLASVVSSNIASTATWAAWWAGDVVGVVLVAPLLLTAAHFRAPRDRITLATGAEVAVFLACLSLVAFGVVTGALPMLYLFMPLLVWVAWRFSLLLALSVAAISVVATTLAAVAGRVPFAELPLIGQMVTLQAFATSAVLVTLLVAAATSQWRMAQLAVVHAARRLDEQVKSRTAELATTVDRLRRSEAMLNEAQRIGQVGSWERDLRTDEVTWSDQMFRLYGLVPQSVRVDYATFLDRIHPDDRNRVEASNIAALCDHQMVEMDHRIIWPDGSMHWIYRRGSVVLDVTGTPAKMVGTAQEITAAKMAEQALRASEERFRTLLASVPDAVIGVDTAGCVAFVNERTEELFGYSSAELIGKPIEVLVPPRHRRLHVRHRTRYMRAPLARPMGADLELFALRRDNTEFAADIALSPLRTIGADTELIVAAVRDVTERRLAEAAARELREARQRRRQALEINDTVLQGLSAAIYSLDRGDASETARIMVTTLDTARTMMASLLGADSLINADDLLRRAPAVSADPGLSPPAQPSSAREPSGVRVVLADDSPDIRKALRAVLDSVQGMTLVAEAADGAEAVRVVTEHSPDVVLLDLAMPVLDGLSALSQIREARPETKVIVFSGYSRTKVAQQVLSLGAAGYVEKGASIDELLDMLIGLFPEIRI